MEKYLNKGIKEIINQFSKVGDILNEYNIACVPCNVGTCLLKDVVEVHNLSYEKEHELLKRIAGIIYAGKEIEIPRIERKIKHAVGGIRYSPPMKRLVDEHTIIKKLLALIPSIVEDLDISHEEGKNLILGCADFIRSFADRYHHAKEEDTLFKKFSEDLEIIKAMLEEHQIGRGHVKAMLEALERGDNRSVKDSLMSYRELLTEHIRKEDEILYPWMDRSLTMNQIGDLFSRFTETDERFKDAQAKYEGFVRNLEEKFKRKEVGTNA